MGSPVWLSHVSANEALDQIGTEAYNRLESIVHWLYGKQCLMQFRIAPSLVTRNDAELLGTSYPRFALRCHLTLSGINLGFINCRRLERIKKSISKWGAPRRDDGKIFRIDDVIRLSSDEISLKDQPSELIPNQPCIGDSILSPPRHFENFHILQVDLGAAYGEGESIRGTPYVKHMKLGGMCAQAACQMAVLLLIDRAASVHAVAEITAIASEQLLGKKESDGIELDLGGMKPEGIVAYLSDERVGLSAHIEFSTPDLGFGSMTAESRKAQAYAAALRSYVQSNFPVILPVDSGRLRDLSDVQTVHIEPVNRTQRIPVPEHWSGKLSEGSMRNHAVVVVGCSNQNPDQFVLHDPGMLPFLEASTEQLVWSRPYADCAPVYSSDHLAGLMMIPVVPKPVRLPLLETNHRNAHGLMILANDVLRAQLKDFPRWSASSSVTHEYRLIEVSDGKYKGIDHVAPLKGCDISDPIGSIRNALTLCGKLPDGWYWLQSTECHLATGPLEKSLWVWNAMRPPPSGLIDLDADEIVADYLITVIRENKDGIWKVSHFSTSFEPEYRQSTTSHGHNFVDAFTEPGILASVKPSLVSSIYAHGICYQSKKSTPYWDSRVGCELYTFMQTDIPNLFKRAHGIGNVVEFLATRCDQDLHDAVKVLNGLECRLTGFASFIPEVINAVASRRDQAVKALFFLHKLAAALNDLRDREGHLRHSIRTIELVCGSRVSEVYPGRRRDRSGKERLRFFAERRSDSEAIDILIESLLRVRELVLSTGIKTPLFTLELEPGPIFALRSFQTLTYLCDQMRKHDLTDLFRINVDSSHFLIAGIDITALPDEILDLVYHVHLSENHRAAHFGDVRLGDCTNLQVHGRIVDHLRRFFAKNDENSYSGVISLEIEAAKTMQHVDDSLNAMFTILKGDAT